MLNIRIFRKFISLSYRRDPPGPDAWHTQDANNSLDVFEFLDDDKVLMTSAAQTVANAEGLIDGVHEYDTIAPGEFSICAYVEQREFKCFPHGIVGAITKRGEPILADSTTLTNKSRWLVHDWKNHTDPPVDTRVAWSAGCIVLPDEGLTQFNKLLDDNGVLPGILIPTELFEEGES